MKAILTKYHGPTNTRGSRISASDSDGNRVTVPYDYALSNERNHNQATLALCAKMRWGGTLIRGWGNPGYVYVFDPREPRNPQAPGTGVAVLQEASGPFGDDVLTVTFR